MFPQEVLLIILLNTLSFGSFAFMMVLCLFSLLGMCCNKEFEIGGSERNKETYKLSESSWGRPLRWGEWNPLRFLLCGVIDLIKGYFLGLYNTIRECGCFSGILCFPLIFYLSLFALAIYLCLYAVGVLLYFSGPVNGLAMTVI